MMIIEKFTMKAQDALERACRLAVKKEHRFVTAWHLLAGMLEQEGSRAQYYLSQAGIDLTKLGALLESRLIIQPRALMDAQQTPINRDLERVFIHAEEASSALEDKYIGIKHIMLGMLEAKEILSVLTEAGGQKDKLSALLKEAPQGKFKGSENAPGEFEYLAKYATDLTELAKEGKLDPVIGRDDEIRLTIQVLSRRLKNNPIIIGEPGVGKTAIVEGLAQRIIQGDVPDDLRFTSILALDMGQMVAGAKYRGEFEERFKRLLQEVSNAGNIIMFIDEIHMLIGAGGAQGAMDAANLLKPALSRGEIRCIGATTLSEYRKHIEKDAALMRRFQVVMVEEPGLEETISILRGVKEKYEVHHGVRIIDAALTAAARLSSRYIMDRFLPDKAIDLIDQTAASVRINLSSEPEREKAAIDEEEVAVTVSRWTGIPVSKMLASEKDKLLHLEDRLRQRVVGQNEALCAIAKAVRRSRAAVQDPNRPIASFLMLGPSGVGKTELAKTLAEFMFDDERSLVRIDMSEFMEKHSAARLIGAPPGYIGYEEGGVLTNKVRQKPYSVILFDEVEKAHPDVFNLFLQLLDDGRLTDSQGQVVNFTNAIVIMTSNLGSTYIKPAETEEQTQQMNEGIMQAVRSHFRPEFLNRLDDILIFRQLTPEVMLPIVDIQLKRLNTLLQERDIHLQVMDEAKSLLAEEGFNPLYGARPLKRVIQSRLQDYLAQEIISGNIKEGDTVLVMATNGELVIRAADNS